MPIWKTPSSRVYDEEAPQVTRLVSYPSVLELVLPYLCYSDVFELIFCGSPLLQDSIYRLLRETRFQSIPEVSGITFPIKIVPVCFSLVSSILTFPNLTNLQIISPSFEASSETMERFGALPSSLKSLTFWFATDTTSPYTLFFHSLGRTFPLLECLRLNIEYTNSPSRGRGGMEEGTTEFFESLPSTLRCLSLVGRFSPSVEQLTEICCPKRLKMSNDGEISSFDKKNSRWTVCASSLPKYFYSREYWEYRFPYLEILEFSGENEEATSHLDPRIFPPLLHTFISLGAGKCLSILPPLYTYHPKNSANAGIGSAGSSSRGENHFSSQSSTTSDWAYPEGIGDHFGDYADVKWLARPRSALKLVQLSSILNLRAGVLPNDASWYECLPRTLTSLSVAEWEDWDCNRTPRAAFGHFQNLKSFHAQTFLLPLSSPYHFLPNELPEKPHLVNNQSDESLGNDARNEFEKSDFSEASNSRLSSCVSVHPPSLKKLSIPCDMLFHMPIRLTHLELKVNWLCDGHNFAFLPRSLERLHLYCLASTKEYVATSILPFLPLELLYLRMGVLDFPCSFLKLLPRSLLELRVSAESMMLLDHSEGADWDKENDAFDMTDLPPNLQILHLWCPIRRIRVPEEQLSNLPRSIVHLILPGVLIEPPQPSLWTSLSNSILGSTEPSVPQESIAKALERLPSNCLVFLRFFSSTLKRKGDLTQSLLPLLPRRPKVPEDITFLAYKGLILSPIFPF